MTGTDRSARAPEHHDRHVYAWVSFERGTIEFAVKALKFYEEILTAETNEFEADPHLRSLLTEDIQREFRIGRGLRDVTRMLGWLEGHLAKSEDRFECDLEISHGDVRYLKSVSLLYLNALKHRRNALSAKPNVTAQLLAALDRQITVLEEKFCRTGVFGGASVLPLLAAQEAPTEREAPEHANDGVSLSNVRRPKPVVVSTIEILDQELRGRCLDLFEKFKESGESERNDTVVVEATRILENRLRVLIGTTDGVSGADLVSRAFAGQNAPLKVSAIPAEQEAVHLLFRGAFGFIRNPVHHRLLSDLSATRVLQVLGLIDYLLSVAESGVSVRKVP